MLKGIPFDLTVEGEVHHRETGVNGEIWFCRQESATIHIEELTREVGGALLTTTVIPESWSLGCGASDLWIGNAYVAPPLTGAGPSRIGIGRGGPANTF
jgi:hypothetical protein